MARKFIKDREKLILYYAGYCDPRTAPFKAPESLKNRMVYLLKHLDDNEFQTSLFILEKALSQQNKGFTK